MPKYFMPVGNTDFREIRETGLYYIDKTMLIDQLVNQSRAKVTLFTRPRRFGKSLNMSMLQHFFDIREDSKALFEGLQVFENKTLCTEWMNQYPTILVSFKDVESNSFESAFKRIRTEISKLYERYDYLYKNNSKLSELQKKLFEKILMRESDEEDLKESLVLLTQLMYEYYGKHIILLIDEYDVPMAKGDANGYYREITDIMRSMYGKSLKDNPYIKIAVLTGCLRIAEESIFTGLNNLSVKTITDTDYDECFGFTNEEMNKLLADTELLHKHTVFKEWYDGYVFGDKEVYCPWDVLNYVDALQKEPDALPINYWANTSGNDAIKRFLESRFDVSADFEKLLGGGFVEKIINPDITYGDLTKNETNLWSVLYMTGYLTILPGSLPKSKSCENDDMRGKFDVPFKLKFPNMEIKRLFEKTIAVWFKERILADDRTELFAALWSGDAVQLANIISRYLRSTISYHDYSEQFYHAFLTGLFSGVGNVSVRSNREVGEGRADVIVKNEYTNQAVVIELKITDSPAKAAAKCDEALRQIEDKGYAVPLSEDEGYDVTVYGAVFYKKRCFIKKREFDENQTCKGSLGILRDGFLGMKE